MAYNRIPCATERGIVIAAKVDLSALVTGDAQEYGSAFLLSPRQKIFAVKPGQTGNNVDETKRVRS
jgi:hypothetical protein